MERRPRNSGRVTFYKTAVLSQVPVLSKSEAAFLFFLVHISHYLVPWDEERAGVSV